MPCHYMDIQIVTVTNLAKIFSCRQTGNLRQEPCGSIKISVVYVTVLDPDWPDLENMLFISTPLVDATKVSRYAGHAYAFLE